jgi:alkaline phosphatase isozyme conversion protein
MRRTTLAVIAVVILAAVFALGFAAVTTHTSDAAQEAVPVAGPTAGTTAYEYMAELSDELGPRVAGLSTEVRAGDRILQWFGDLGYTPDTQDFTFTVGDKTRHSRNIVAVKPGVSAQQIVIGAHYDSVSVGRGAFDNASGVALMMELADALRDEQTPYALVFVAFGAEETGLRGSDYYVAEMSDQARADTVLMINFDSVATGDRLYCYSGKDAPWPQLALRSMARGLGEYILTSPGLNKDYPYGTTGDWSDHTAFRKAGIPYLYFEATNWLLGEKDGYLNTVKDREVWHSKKDTLSYIEQRYPGRMERQLETEFTALTAFLTTYEVPAGATQ